MSTRLSLLFLSSFSFAALSGCSSSPTTVRQGSPDTEIAALTSERESSPSPSEVLGGITARHPIGFGITESTESDELQSDTRITVPVSPQNIGRYEVDPGEGYDGVVQLFLPERGNRRSGFLCTGSLLSTGMHVLTAAHCFTDGNTGAVAVGRPTIFFDLPEGRVEVRSDAFTLHPDWTGLEVIAPGDIAVVKLSEQAPAGAERYQIYRQSNEAGQVMTKVGYGQIGTGQQGILIPSESAKLAGQNRFDVVYADCTDFAIGTNAGETQLGFDFDTPGRGNDAYDFLCGIPDDRGLRRMEINSAPGDSGGPAFINGQVAGVTSHGFTLLPPLTPDVDGQLNSSFGEFSGETRVSFYQDWIDARLSE